MATRLLVVEDDDRIRTVLRLGLEDEGYQVTEATSAESALDHMQSQPTDMMIVDLMLGEMDGSPASGRFVAATATCRSSW